MSERSRIAQLAAKFAVFSPGVHVGIGDDAAVLGPDLVWTVDAQVEGTHFLMPWVSWHDIGFRSFMAAASDLAAMGAHPLAALSSLVLTPAVDDAALDAMATGQAAAARVVGAPIVGGNLARGHELSLTTTLLGQTASPVLRCGARPGDGVWLSGEVGLAAAGLALLQRGAHLEVGKMADGSIADTCLRAFRRPVARIREGKQLSGVAHAAIDISDGLAQDAEQLAEASDVSIVFDAQALLAHGGKDLAEAAILIGQDALDLALNGGEDYALLAVCDQSLPGFVRIGEVRESKGDARTFLATERGITPLAPRGFDHF